MLAMIAIPSMVTLTLVAPLGVPIVLGDKWTPAVPVIQILAITGARQAIYSVVPPLMMGFGRADWQLRFACGAVTVQIAGIVIGLQAGIVGVAWGYTIAGFIMTPVMIEIQRRLVDVSWREHAATVLPPVHAMLWGSAAYLLFGFAGLPDGLHLVLGAIAALGVFAVVLWLAHPRYSREVLVDVRAVLGVGQPKSPAPSEVNA
jgi:PST family polysaccharide transporter